MKSYSAKRLAIGALVGLASLSAAQTWTPLLHPPTFSASNPLLLTDGTVMVQDGDNDQWYRLTPDNKGNYINGTWSTLASTPGYGPLYYGSAVLPDGRVFTMGGEYNLTGYGVWSNLGYIYNPLTNTWTFQSAPTGWGNIGDMGSVMLGNGKLLLANPLSSQFALFDPMTNTLPLWTTGKADGNDEEGLVMLPNGNVLTVDATIANSSEILDTSTGIWSSGGATPANLVGGGEEIGPMVLRPDGTVICFGGGGHNCVYDTVSQTWSTAPDFPVVTAGQLDCADAPAVLLTNGNVLVQASPGLFNSGSAFFEWDGTLLNPVPATAYAPYDPSYVGTFLMLPSGQVLYTDIGGDAEIYTSAGGPQDSWRPTITNYSSTLRLGLSYPIAGTQFNGLSQDSGYGDDEQNATNYPLIRVTNNATGDVQYCREFNPSTMAICTGAAIVQTNFTVPAGMEVGPSTLEVVCNGIPSVPVAVTIEADVAPDRALCSPAQVVGGGGGHPVLKVFLNAPAPAGGLTISLSSSTPGVASVPATLHIAVGKTQGSASITAAGVLGDTPVSLSASYGGATVYAGFTDKTPTPLKVTLAPNEAVGGSATVVTGTVTMNAPAPIGGLTVSLTSTNSAIASVPATVTVPAGADSATFNVTTSSVAVQKSINIKATRNGSTKLVHLTVDPPVLTALTLSTYTVLGGSPTVVTGTVTINAAAPAAGVTVSLSSSNTGAASVPATVVITSGMTSATFTVTHHVVAATTTTDITGSANGSMKTKTLNVKAH